MMHPISFFFFIIEEGKLCERDLKNLREWKMNPKPNKMPAKELTESGKKEMREFAKRLKDSYPELLRVRNVSESDYKVCVSCDEFEYFYYFSFQLKLLLLIV